MTDDDLCFASAADLLEVFRVRKLKPTELLAALQLRAKAVNPTVNALKVPTFGS